MESLLPELIKGIVTSSPVAAVLLYFLVAERKRVDKKDEQALQLTERIITAMNSNTDSLRELRHAIGGKKE